jgi:hypothetical protein
VQRAVGLDLALKTMQAQAEKLQAELDQAKRADGTSFLGNASSWGRSAPAANAAQEPLAPLQQTYAKGATRTGASAAPASPWGSGMMANLASTAAGVVAGSFLYQGIQQLMGHHNPGIQSPMATSDTNAALSDEDVSSTLDDPNDNDSLALDDGGFDSSDLG